MNSELFADLLEDIIKLLTLFGKGMAMAFAGKYENSFIIDC